MKKTSKVLIHVFFSLFLFMNTALADPPNQAIRLGFMDGQVSFLPAGENQWVSATLNRPLITGDGLWTEPNSRAELQLGRAAIRLNAQTSIKVLGLDNKSTQIELDQGQLNLNLWNSGSEFEIDTPNLALSATQAGDYRIDVDGVNHTTRVTVRSGLVLVYGESQSYQIKAGESYSFNGTQLQFQALSLNAPDDFDAWCSQRNALYANSNSKNYVSSEVIGYADLDNNGQWKADPSYGNIWYPKGQDANWAPYSQGEWIWVEPWGWTWNDVHPWGFAPFHYGRWLYNEQGWAWVPGPIHAEPIYAPSLVVFTGGSNFAVGNGAIGWLPLGPGEAYIPAFSYSKNYFTQVNINNTRINQNQINNIYRNPNQPFNYQNMHRPNAVTAVSEKTFTHAEFTANARLNVSKSTWTNAQFHSVAPLAPTNHSVIGNAKAVRGNPGINGLSQPVLVKNKPAPAPLPFADKEALLAKNPGKPLDAKTLAEIKPGTSPEREPTKFITPNSVSTHPMAIPHNSIPGGNGFRTPPVNSIKEAPHPNFTTPPQIIRKPQNYERKAQPQSPALGKPEPLTPPLNPAIGSHREPQGLKPGINPGPRVMTPSVPDHPVVEKPQTVKPLPQGSVPKVKPLPQGSVPTVKPLPQGSVPQVQSLPQGSVPKVKPLPQGSVPKVKPLPQGSVPKVKPLPQGSVPRVKPLPQGSVPKVQSLPQGSVPKVQSLPQGSVPKVQSLPQGSVPRVKPLPQGLVPKVKPPESKVQESKPIPETKEQRNDYNPISHHPQTPEFKPVEPKDDARPISRPSEHEISHPRGERR